MRFATGLLALSLCASHSAAADPPKFAVPKSWEKLADTPNPWAFLAARDGYAVTIDAVIVPGTENHRAQSFTHTVYRHKLGEAKPEQLHSVVTTHGYYTLLGPKGAVAAGWFADCRAVYLPGHKPIPLPEGKVRFAAHEFVAGGLLCAGLAYLDKKEQCEIVLFPLDAEKGTRGDARVVRKWFPAEGPDGFAPDFYHGRLFLRGDFAAYGGTLPDPAHPGFPKPAFQVWDARNEKVAWNQPNATLAAAAEQHAYWFPEPNVVARRALDGTGKAERLTLPKDVIRLNFAPPHLFALAKREKEWVLTRFDLATGERAEYDLRVPDGRQVTSASGVAVLATPDDPQYGTVLPLGLDAASGEVRALHGKALYRVPVAKREAGAKSKWEPLP